MRVADARLHLDEAMKLLTLEAWAGADPDNMERVEDFTVAEELERVDRALGPKGKSMFAKIADDIRSAYVEIKAAREALK
jgi:hypothetical protein